MEVLDLVDTHAQKRLHLSSFHVRVPPELRRQLALEAAESGVSLNRLASDKLRRAGQVHR